MAVDAMEIDSAPVSAAQAGSEKDRKRKHKHKDEFSSPSSKKRKHEKSDKKDKKDMKKKEKSSSKSSSSSKKDKSSRPDTTTAATPAPVPESPYTLTTATLYLPLSPISISPTHALASLLAEHLSPLLLTYYPPFQGIILAYSNASISSEPPSPSSPTSTTSPNPQPLTLATTAGEYGVMYVYLTATFLVFRPQRGQTLEGWVNVQSEGFLGAVVLNLFSVGIERKRLPSSWKWIPPGEEDKNESGTTTNPNSDEDDDSTPSTPFDPEKEHFNPVPLASDSNPFSYDQGQVADATSGAIGQLEGEEGTTDQDSLEGHFQSVSGHRVRGTIKFRVVDIDVIPGTERDRGFLSIEGTMLSEEEESKVVEDERNGVMAAVPSSVRKVTAPMSSGGIIVPQREDVELEESPNKKARKSKK
jgi:DNA-directed RNA polymerase I subunit RPA43